jgi:hypothetical protein
MKAALKGRNHQHRMKSCEALKGRKQNITLFSQEQNSLNFAAFYYL